MGLPQSLTSLAHYRACLDRFHSFYQPYEELLGRFQDWPECDIDLPNRAHAPALAQDLEALEPSEAAGLAPQAALPLLSEFPHALGALYVTEGSTLGSQFILRHLGDVLGTQLAGADRFFRGYGPETGTHWSLMRAALDRFGRKHPGQTPAVIAGATRTFQAIGQWMAADWMKP
jgi:heme oxygenase